MKSKTSFKRHQDQESTFKVFSEFPFTNSSFMLNIPLSLNQIHEGNKTEIWFLKFTSVNVKL